ncbi:hypothetical protein [Kineococcus aurantiacus]|uniref:Restriction endonuclease n=1 Tax=Kineococcus aurantiacus TaxID=37633 RepID=A0A7Y9DH35_9ACTN|nr:hypothetical protein [Kineococcus aurantiacus]NYD20951.1 hypothetical protein [Kineococcus aurantiacus]
MRVSELFGLTGSQGSFDFIDVDVEHDTPLFIDPSALATLQSPWANSCISSIQSFFQAVLDKIRAKDSFGAMALLRELGEVNATHLGYSSVSQGSGVGDGLAEKFYDELANSDAVASGFVTDLEDTALLVEGVREDRISDVTTNIIREQLVEYTQATAEFYEIPTQDGLAIGPFWNARVNAWEQATATLPLTKQGPLLLVPKSIVRRNLYYNPGEYYRHYVLEYFKQQELDSMSPLVYLLKKGPHKGEPRVKKGDVENKYRQQFGAGRHNPGVEKRINLHATQQNPDLLLQFKSDKAETPPRPTGHEAIADATGVDAPWLHLNDLLKAVTDLAPGQADATAYERAVEALLAALFYPDLVNPVRQRRLHDGRKIIDISYTNVAAKDTFFYWLATHYPAANVVVECKNYSKPLGNKEYDQLAGRFSPSRGRYGLLVYRKVEGKDAFLESCRDTAKDDRGFITPLDDDDLAQLVQEAQEGGCAQIGGLLHQRFEFLTS